VFAPLARLAAHATVDPATGLLLLWVVFGAAFMCSRAAVLLHRARGDAWMVTGAP
jgi:hypothetical protein